MTKYEKLFLTKLLDKYERSISFTGHNQINQRLTLNIAKEIPEYKDDASYDVFCAVNESVEKLIIRGFVSAKKMQNGVIKSIILEISSIDAVYTYLERASKKETNAALRELLLKYSTEDELLRKYCTEQLARLDSNKTVQHFDGDLQTFEMLLQAIREIRTLETETFERDFSIRLFGDSKAFEKIKSKTVSLLYEYGDFAEKNTVLHEMNVVSNPGHVFFKGNGKITISGQTIDLGCLNGDMALSTSLLKDVERIEVMCDAVMTIENLTTFNAFYDENTFVIYLGGYHNTIRREFICKLHNQNPHKRYYHFGDIDAGGFYILKHLRDKTGIHFLPYKMDAETLRENMRYTKPLTDHDRKRLAHIQSDEFRNVVEFMLANNCKLEQEALD